MKHSKYIYGLAGLIILIAIVQFADSFQYELFTILQSFFITEYFVEGKGMSFNTAAAAMVLPVCRNYFIGYKGNNWRILYKIGISYDYGNCDSRNYIL